MMAPTERTGYNSASSRTIAGVVALQSQTATCAPSAANARAVAKPMPLAPPTRTAEWSFSFKSTDSPTRSPSAPATARQLLRQRGAQRIARRDEVQRLARDRFRLPVVPLLQECLSQRTVRLGIPRVELDRR